MEGNQSEGAFHSFSLSLASGTMVPMDPPTMGSGESVVGSWTKVLKGCLVVILRQYFHFVTVTSHSQCGSITSGSPTGLS